MTDNQSTREQKVSRLVQLYIWACQRLYHELAWSYDWVSTLVSFGRWRHWRRLALLHRPRSAVSSRQRVLELGFGTGELLRILAGEGVNVTGVDPSPVMQIVAARKLAWAGEKAGLVQAQAQALPFADGAFDTIFATFPTSYIADERTLCECARVLADGAVGISDTGGRLIVVGLWVALRPRWLQRLLPVFYGEPATQFISAMVRRFAAAGLGATWVQHRDGIFELSVLVADKRPDCS